MLLLLLLLLPLQLSCVAWCANARCCILLGLGFRSFVSSADTSWSIHTIWMPLWVEDGEDGEDEEAVEGSRGGWRMPL
jgi:hypothetical protein